MPKDVGMEDDRLDAIEKLFGTYADVNGRQLMFPYTEEQVRWLVAEVRRLREQNARNIGLLEVCEDLGVQLEASKQRQHAAEADLAALRHRHAEAVEAAFRAGYSAGGNDMSAAHHNEYYVGEDAAWLASEARKGVAS